MTSSLRFALIKLMETISKSFITFTALLLVFANPVFAQTTQVKDIPKPETGMVQSDFATDIKDGIQSTENDVSAQENQKKINENENDDGEQGNKDEGNVDDLHVDEQIDQDEAQSNQQGEEGNGKQEEMNSGDEGNSKQDGNETKINNGFNNTENSNSENQ